MNNDKFFGLQIRSGEDLLSVMETSMTIVQNLTKSRLLVGHEGWAIDPKGRTAFSLITDELLVMQEKGLISIDAPEQSPVAGFISGPVSEENAVDAPVAPDSEESINAAKKSTKKVKQPVAETQTEPAATSEIVVETVDAGIQSGNETSAPNGNNDDNVDATSESF